MLDACEGADSFQEVFARVRARERSAYSELVLVAALIRLGYPARFAASIAGRVLDAVCLVDGCRVFFEVVAPERSDASAKEQLIATCSRRKYAVRIEMPSRMRTLHRILRRIYLPS
jgi:hypothetical protein